MWIRTENEQIALVFVRETWTDVNPPTPNTTANNIIHEAKEICHWMISMDKYHTRKETRYVSYNDCLKKTNNSLL